MVSGRVKQVRVVVLNCRDDGRWAELGGRSVDSVVAAVNEMSHRVDILCLPTTTGLGLCESSALLSLTGMLSELLPDGDWYYPFIDMRSTTVGPPGLWVSVRQISATVDRQPAYSGEPRLSYPLHHHVVETLIGGNLVWLKSVRWPWRFGGSVRGPVAVDGLLASVPAILLGDFATPLDSACSDQTWYTYGDNTEAFRSLLLNGFWDAGQVAAEHNLDETVTAERVTDHILVSRATPARLVPGTFYCGPDWARPHYTGVACTLEFDVQPRRTPRTSRPAANNTIEPGENNGSGSDV